MAFQAGSVHLADYFFRYIDSYFKPKTDKKKLPEQIVQERLSKPQATAPRGCLKERVASPHTENGKSVTFSLHGSHKKIQDVACKPFKEPEEIDLCTEENLEAFIYPACMTWKVERHFDKIKGEKQSLLASKAFLWTVLNYDSIPKLKKTDHEIGVLSRLFVVGQTSFEEKQLVEIATKLIHYPQLFPVFEGLLVLIDGQYHQDFVVTAKTEKNLNVLKVLLDAGHCDPSKLAWKEMSDKCLEVIPHHPLLEHIVGYLEPVHQMEFFNALYTARRWEALGVFFQNEGFLVAFRKNNINGQYTCKLNDIASACVEDSSYQPLLARVISFIHPNNYRYYANQARDHGNKEAHRMLLKLISGG